MSDTKVSVETQSLIDTLEHPFVLIDDDYNIVAANAAYCKNYGVGREDVVGRKCHKVSHRSDRPCHMNGEDCPHKRVFATGEPVQVLHIHYDGNNEAEHVRIKGSPVIGQHGEFFLGEAIFKLANSSELLSGRIRLVGRSPEFQRCIETLTAAANSKLPVLLCGESGAGKDLAARYVHDQSERRAHAFTMVDCSAIAESVFESELFGHERGAFTGCVGRRYGLFEQADGGTLFFNEIGDLPESMQGRLLRVMESGEFRRVGGRDTLSADVRIICASTRNLRKLVAANRFRADLYYRIAGIVCEIPTLRARNADIPDLAQALVARLADENREAYRLTDDAVHALGGYDYPGNVRELLNILRRAAITSVNGVITSNEIKFDAPLKPDGPQITTADAPSMKNLESQYIAELLAEHQGRRATVAQILGISERTLYRKLKQYGLQDIGKA